MDLIEEDKLYKSLFLLYNMHHEMTRWGENMLSNSMNKKNSEKKQEENKNTYIDEVEEYYVYEDDNDYEEYRIVSDNEEEKEEEKEEVKEELKEEKPRKKKNYKIVNRIINIILVIALIILLLVTIDIVLITKYQKGPIFSIPVKTYEDGGTKEYYGIGYKVIKYNQLQGRRDMEIGTYKLKYNTEPINVSALDISIELNNDKDKAFEKYNKKFIRINGILKEYNTKDNKVTIGYIDEDGKYSVDIICNMASDKRELKRLEIFKETTVIGVVTDYDEETDSNAITIYMSNCFAEQ